MRPITTFLLVVAWVIPAAAQDPTPPEDFSRLRMKIGEIVYVTDQASGVEVSGRLRALSPDSLTINGYQFQPSNNLRIARRGDPIWDGAAIGSAVGVLMGMTIGSEACLHRPIGWCALGGGLSYAGYGALIDWLHKGRTTVYGGKRRATKPGSATR